MTNEILNDLAIGLLASISFGGLAIIFFGLIAWKRRSHEKPVQMKPACLRVIIGAIACVVLYGAGYEYFGMAALIFGILTGYYSLTNKEE